MLSRTEFLRSLPAQVTPHLPPALASIQARQPWGWLIQFHYGEPALHYEVAPAKWREGWELGLHFEAKDSRLNGYLLAGFCRYLFEIKDTLGDGFEAETWDKGWTKVYEVYPARKLTEAHQAEVGRRLAKIIACLQPILVELRQGDLTNRPTTD